MNDLNSELSHVALKLVFLKHLACLVSYEQDHKLRNNISIGLML